MFRKLASGLFVGLVLLSCAGRADVKIGSSDEGACLLVDGKPFWVKGVTFTIRYNPDKPDLQEAALADLKAMGGNTIRTWGTGEETQQLLDAANRQGLKVLLGLWLEHGRSGNEGDGSLNYKENKQRMDAQCEHVLNEVKKFKDHPALLGWGLGNEVILNIATEEEKVAYAKYLDEVCRKIKKIDPAHPVISVSAWTISVPYWEKYAPSLDAYGINAYGPAAGAIPNGLAEHGAKKPYFVTEFGPRGAYDSPKDSNGVVMPPPDNEKFDQVSNGWKEWIVGNRSRGCMGGFIFNYGDDWSPTSLWLDMFVKGFKRPAYLAARKAFSGEDPVQNGVQITSMLTAPKTAAPGQWLKARIELRNPDNIKCKIVFAAANQDGTWQERGKLIVLEQQRMNDRDFRIKAPDNPGRYQLYAIAADERQFMSCVTGSVILQGEKVNEEPPQAAAPKAAPASAVTPAVAVTPVAEPKAEPVVAPVETPAAAPASAPAEAAAPQGRNGGSIVKITGDADSGFQMLRNGQPYIIKGAGGDHFLDVLANVGGNTIRTWGVGPETGKLLDEAQAAGIAVTVGIWLGHERHGFDYTSKDDLEKQRDQVEEAVRKFKDHPALLCWGLGNEMEGPTGPGTNPDIWKEINNLARKIKKLDPNHPIMTVVANVSDAKVKAIQEYTPDIDMLGVNAYAGAGGVGRALVSMGWKKPYAITEFGLPGPWEAEHTAWNAPIEPTSREKAAFYYVTDQDIMADKKQCLGSYAFVWGNKQEATASWFGMFLPTGEKLSTVDAMGKSWTGHWPSNRAPVLAGTEIPFAFQRTTGGQEVPVQVTYKDADGDPLTYLWEVYKESTDRRVGGEDEQKPELIASAIKSVGTNGTVTVQTPSQPGAYRLFVTVKDGKGSGAIDNWPFYIE